MGWKTDIVFRYDQIFQTIKVEILKHAPPGKFIVCYFGFAGSQTSKGTGSFKKRRRRHGNKSSKGYIWVLIVPN